MRIRVIDEIIAELRKIDGCAPIIGGIAYGGNNYSVSCDYNPDEWILHCSGRVVARTSTSDDPATIAAELHEQIIR